MHIIEKAVSTKWALRKARRIIAERAQRDPNTSLNFQNLMKFASFLDPGLKM